MNSVDTSVQFTIVCHNISKREYFSRHPVEVIDDEFLKYVARGVENDKAFLLSKNFIPELKFYVTFCYRPPKERIAKHGILENTVNQIMDAFTAKASRQTTGNHAKNVSTLIQRAQGHVSQLAHCGMTAKPLSANDYFQMMYRELNPGRQHIPTDQLPTPIRPNQKPVPESLRRIFPDMDAATIRQQLTESCYDFQHADYVVISETSETEDAEKPTAKYVRTLYMNRLPERTGPLWLSPLFYA